VQKFSVLPYAKKILKTLWCSALNIPDGSGEVHAAPTILQTIHKRLIVQQYNGNLLLGE
jgi:hypothetical protein